MINNEDVSISIPATVVSVFHERLTLRIVAYNSSPDQLFVGIFEDGYGKSNYVPLKDVAEALKPLIDKAWKEQK